MCGRNREFETNYGREYDKEPHLSRQQKTMLGQALTGTSLIGLGYGSACLCACTLDDQCVAVGAQRKIQIPLREIPEPHSLVRHKG